MGRGFAKKSPAYLCLSKRRLFWKYPIDGIGFPAFCSFDLIVLFWFLFCYSSLFFLQGDDGRGTILNTVVERSARCAKDPSEFFSYASGDFELLHRNAWFELRGHIEINTYAHFDSVIMSQARKLNWPVVGFFKRESNPKVHYLIYHQAHRSGGFRSTAQMFSSIVTDWNLFSSLPFCVRNAEDDWGMAKYTFDEVVWKNGRKIDVISTL